MPDRDVVVNIGYGQFHLRAVAAALAQDARLAAVVTGAHVTKALPAVGGPAIRRLNARTLAGVPTDKIHPAWPGEAVFQTSQWLWRLNAPAAVQQWLSAASLDVYQRHAAKTLARLPLKAGDVYHYRSGFGGQSVVLARRRGLVTVCDHSIAHPAVLEGLVASEGRDLSPRPPASPLWRLVSADLELADSILVNSDFVAETFRRAGHAGPVHVVYTGPDGDFLAALADAPERRARSRTTPLRVLFAGTMERRKGVGVAVRAMARLHDADVRFDVVGRWDPASASVRDAMAALPNVHLSDKVERHKLPRIMREADVILLPSLAEGSARVVIEGMAAGCVPVVTPNAGAPVRDGVNGRVVSVADGDALAEALLALAEDVDEVHRLSDAAQAEAARHAPDEYVRDVLAAYDAAYPA